MHAVLQLLDWGVFSLCMSWVCGLSCHGVRPYGTGVGDGHNHHHYVCGLDGVAAGIGDLGLSFEFAGRGGLRLLGGGCHGDNFGGLLNLGEVHACAYVRTYVRTYVATSLSVCVDEATQHSHIYVRTYVSLAYSRSCPAFAASRPHLLCTSCSASSVRRYRRVRTAK